MNTCATCEYHQLNSSHVCCDHPTILEGSGHVPVWHAMHLRATEFGCVFHATRQVGYHGTQPLSDSERSDTERSAKEESIKLDAPPRPQPPAPLPDRGGTAPRLNERLREMKCKAVRARGLQFKAAPHARRAVSLSRL